MSVACAQSDHAANQFDLKVQTPTKLGAVPSLALNDTIEDAQRQD